MSAQQSALSHYPSQLRETLAWVILSLLGVLLIATLAIVLSFARPRVKTTQIGSLADFPPSERPYKVFLPIGTLPSEQLDSNSWFYIVNTGSELLALDYHAPHPTAPCHLLWSESNGRFEDPCSGAKFTLTGGYIEGLVWGNMDRHPIEVDKSGTIMVDTSSLIKQSKEEVIERCRSTATQVFRIDSNPHFSCEDLWQLYQKRMEPIQNN